MPTDAPDWREIDSFEGSFGWIAHPDETMQRASHAIAVDENVWVVDPVDVSGLDERLADLGTVRGVLCLLDRHKRDCATVANRHDVPVFLPHFFEGVAADLDATVERVRHDLPDSDFAVHGLYDTRFWQEAIIYDRDRGVLLVPEAVGTTAYFRAGTERLGVHPLLRMTPPSKLRRLDPERILVGHGAGLHDDAAAALHSAIAGSRVRTPRLVAETVCLLFPV